MNYYKVENGKPEKLKEFIFKTTYKEFNKTESIPSLFYFLTELNDVKNTYYLLFIFILNL